MTPEKEYAEKGRFVDFFRGSKDGYRFEDLLGNEYVIEVLEKARKGNLDLVLERCRDITVKDFIKLCENDGGRWILKEAKEENLEVFFNHFKGITLKDFIGACGNYDVGAVLKYARKENLEVLLKYSDINTPEEFKKLCEIDGIRKILNNAREEDLESFLTSNKTTPKNIIRALWKLI
ncbi:MAG: hypothetical protein ACP5HJ_02275 [Candidatus Micrarchaeia archaeon]